LAIWLRLLVDARPKAGHERGDVIAPERIAL
jgi:hypothetical protein